MSLKILITLWIWKDFIIFPCRSLMCTSQTSSVRICTCTFFAEQIVWLPNQCHILVSHPSKYLEYCECVSISLFFISNCKYVENYYSKSGWNEIMTDQLIGISGRWRIYIIAYDFRYFQIDILYNGYLMYLKQQMVLDLL